MQDNDQQMGNAPLAGVRVLSLAHQLPGPYATLLLADLGADVVILEPPWGDPVRQFEGFFESVNRNKRSVVLDLKTEAGHKAFLQIVHRTDILMEGFSPGTMKRLGADFPALQEVNPRLVFVSISGFGQAGPYRDRPAHDVSYQAMSGFLYQRARDLEPGPAPDIPVGDLSSGMFAALGALAAFHAQGRDGKGAYVDVSVADGLVSWMSTHLVPVMNGTGGPGYPFGAGLGLYRCADDKLISLSVAHEDTFWARLCKAAGLAELADMTEPERQVNRELLRKSLANSLCRRTLAEWEAEFEAAEVPFGPVLDLDEVIESDQVRARELIVEVPGTRDIPARNHIPQPMRIGEWRSSILRHSPKLGEHTTEVLTEVGLTSFEIEELIRSGVAFDPTPDFSRSASEQSA